MARVEVTSTDDLNKGDESASDKVGQTLKSGSQKVGQSKADESGSQKVGQSKADESGSDKARKGADKKGKEMIIYYRWEHQQRGLPHIHVLFWD